MLSRILPAVNSKYSTQKGEHFTVIGTGTGGVVIEYFDGRVELIPNQEWQNQSLFSSNLKQH